MATITTNMTFYPSTRFSDAKRNPHIERIADAYTKRYLSYLGVARMGAGVTIDDEMVKIWLMGDHTIAGEVRSGDIVLAPCHIDSFLAVTSLETELKGKLAVLRFRKSGNKVVLTPIGLLGVPTGGGPMDGMEEAASAFSLSVFSSDCSLVLEDGDVHRFFVLGHEQNELRAAVEEEEARIKFLRGRDDRAGDNGGGSSSTNQSLANRGGGSGTDMNGERIKERESRGMGSGNSNNGGGVEKGYIADLDGHIYWVGKKPVPELIELASLLTFRSRLLSARTLRYLTKSLGFVATGAELLAEMNKAMARNEYGSDVELRNQLQQFATVQSLRVFQDKECLESFFSGKFMLIYGNASLAFFTRSQRAEQIQGPSWNGPPMEREQLDLLKAQVQNLFEVVEVFHPLPEGMGYGHILQKLKGSVGYELLVSSDDYSRWRLESAAVKFFHAMVNSEGRHSDHDLSTSEGVWSLLLTLFEEAAVKFAEHVLHPHTVWGVSPSGWQSVTPAKKCGVGATGNRLEQQPTKTVKEGKKKKARSAGKRGQKRVKTEKEESGGAEAKEDEEEEEEEKEEHIPCYYGLMTLRGVVDPSTKALVNCHQIGIGGTKAGKCARCIRAKITNIKNVQRKKEEASLREFERKAKNGASDRVQDMAVAWRKALGKE
jgi:hypothetical protein